MNPSSLAMCTDAAPIPGTAPNASGEDKKPFVKISRVDNRDCLFEHLPVTVEPLLIRIFSQPSQRAPASPRVVQF